MRRAVLWIGLVACLGGAQAQDATRGKDLFVRRCSGCHSLDRDKEGPRLGGVFGRVSGSVASFTYSEALKNARVTWDESNLEKWLANPDNVAPGNEMSFHVDKADERGDIIAYLKACADGSACSTN